ncbi:MAG TPA: Ig-like domain-containing protein [Iamia sp.]
MKRSFQAVLAVLVVVGGLAVVAPAGAVAPPAPKVFTLTASRSSAVYSQAVKLSLTITPKGGGAPRGGTVTFNVDGVPIGTATATTRITNLTTTTIPPGTHALTADYAGDPVTAPSTSTSVPITVTPAPTAMNVEGDGYVPEGEPIVIKASIRSLAPALTSRRPNGRVSFMTSCRSGTVAVNANGVATWRPVLCPGEHSVRVTYDGTDRYAPTGPLSITVSIGDSVGVSAVDQANDGNPAGFVYVEHHVENLTVWGQIFTAGVTGELDAVELPDVSWYRSGGNAPGRLLISIQTVDGDGVPTGETLAEGSLDITVEDEGIGHAGRIALEPWGIVKAGTRYALVVDTEVQPEGEFGGWRLEVTTGNQFADPLLVRQNEDPWASDDFTDLVFRTWVIPNP